MMVTGRPEVTLWCQVIKQLFYDILEIKRICCLGTENIAYRKRQSLQLYLYSEDFEEVCDRANMDHKSMVKKLEEHLSLEH